MARLLALALVSIGLLPPPSFRRRRAGRQLGGPPLLGAGRGGPRARGTAARRRRRARREGGCGDGPDLARAADRDHALPHRGHPRRSEASRVRPSRSGRRPTSRFRVDGVFRHRRRGAGRLAERHGRQPAGARLRPDLPAGRRAAGRLDLELHGRRDGSPTPRSCRSAPRRGSRSSAAVSGTSLLMNQRLLRRSGRRDGQHVPGSRAGNF